MDAVASKRARRLSWSVLPKTGHAMPSASSRARLRWASKKRTFRRRWPVYLVTIILCITAVALAIIIVNNVDEPAKTPPTPIPKAIR